MREFFNFRILHQRLWQWLSEHPEKKKRDWPEWKINGGWIPTILHLDFACEATRLNGFFNIEKNTLYCRKCPVQWDCDSIGCDEYLEIFKIFDNNKRVFSETAEHISKLKWEGKDQFFRDELTEVPFLVCLSTDPYE